MKLANTNHVLLVVVLLVCLALGQVLGSTSTRIIIRYSEDSFVQDVLDFAVENKLLANIPSRRIIAINIESDLVLDLLELDPRVEDVEEDSIQVAFRGLQDDAVNVNGEEVAGYGISMIQADQLWDDIPLVQTDLKLCIVE